MSDPTYTDEYGRTHAPHTRWRVSPNGSTRTLLTIDEDGVTYASSLAEGDGRGVHQVPREAMDTERGPPMTTTAKQTAMAIAEEVRAKFVCTPCGKSRNFDDFASRIESALIAARREERKRVAEAIRGTVHPDCVDGVGCIYCAPAKSIARLVEQLGDAE